MVSTSKTPFIRSVAVWVDPLYAPGTDTQVLLNVYSHPLCATSLNSTATSLNAPDGTVPTQYDEKFPDYMNTYTGSGPIFKSAAYPDKEPGAWVCFQMQAKYVVAPLSLSSSFPLCPLRFPTRPARGPCSFFPSLALNARTITETELIPNLSVPQRFPYHFCKYHR